MIKKTIYILVIILMGIFIVVVSIERYKSSVNEKYYRNEQEKIANILGVKIEDFPPIIYFPYGYFESKLVPGMNIEEVHGLIKGYVSVEKCGDTVENYFYISEYGKNTLEFSILYDENLNYFKLISEDRGAHIYSPECVPGQLKPQK